MFEVSRRRRERRSGGKTDALDAVRAFSQRAQREATRDPACQRRTRGSTGSARGPRGTAEAREPLRSPATRPGLPAPALVLWQSRSRCRGIGLAVAEGRSTRTAHGLRGFRDDQEDPTRAESPSSSTELREDRVRDWRCSENDAAVGAIQEVPVLLGGLHVVASENSDKRN